MVSTPCSKPHCKNSTFLFLEAIMVSVLLIAVTVSIAIIAVLAILFSIFLYLRHKKAKRKMDEAQLIYGANLEAERNKKKKSWKQRLITRKTIK